MARGGTVAGVVGVPANRADSFARAGRELLERAAAFRSDGTRVNQIHAALDGEEVFAVTGADGRFVVAVVSERVAPGLVFYDLKRCLAAAEEDRVGA